MSRGQSRQAVLLGPLAYFPSSQLEQVVDPIEVEMLPLGQGAQVRPSSLR